jgi:hypothetical protein
VWYRTLSISMIRFVPTTSRSTRPSQSIPPDVHLSADLDARLGQDADGPGLQAGGGSDVARGPGGQDLPHGRDAGATALGQLAQHRVQTRQQSGAPGQGGIDGSLQSGGMDDAGQVEQRSCGRGDRDALEHRAVVRAQQAGLVEPAQRRRPSGVVRPGLGDVERIEPEAGQFPERRRRAVGCHRPRHRVQHGSHHLHAIGPWRPRRQEDPLGQRHPIAPGDTSLQPLAVDAEASALEPSEDAVLLSGQQLQHFSEFHGTECAEGV